MVDRGVLQQDEKSLRRPSVAVTQAQLTSPRLKKLLKQLALTLDACPEGVALSAPQIGVNVRVFAIRADRLASALTEETSTEAEVANPTTTPNLWYFFNPEINKKSKQQSWLEEGCLSVKDWYGLVRRHQKVSLRAWDEHGQTISRNASGLLAQIFQHELDHLNGELFIDKAKELKKISSEKKSDQSPDQFNQL